MTDSDTIKASFLARRIRLLEEARNNKEDQRELTLEMRKAELSKVEIDGIALAAKRTFESAEKREHRVSVEQVADELGDLADTPLGEAALRHVKNDPGVRRAMKSAEKMAKSIKELGVGSTVHVDGDTFHVTQDA